MKLCAPYRLLVLFSLLSLSTEAQQNTDSISTVTLNEVEVSALRTKIAPLDAPVALSVVNLDANWSGAKRSLGEYLTSIPGVFTLNSSNYAQDLRISIRGFGARSAFGIRGIKLVVDGIPETTPDGQGQLDNLPLSLIRTISVIRGPSALLYGNASGGVLSIDTQPATGTPSTQISLEGGGYGQRQLSVTQELGNPANAYLLHYTHQRIDNYRTHSGVENNLVNLRSKHQLSGRTTLSFQFNHTSSPLALDPGGLTLTEFTTDPSAARSLNVSFDASERLTHTKVGAALKHEVSARASLSAYGFYSSRDFDAKLPFESGGQVSLLRSYGGQGFEITTRIGPTLNLQLGYDWASQRDHRQRYDNQNGLRGTLNLDQFEHFSSLGSYAIATLRKNGTLVNGGVRYDRNRLKLSDQFTADGNDSDVLRLNAISPQVGITKRLATHWRLFGGYALSYETPALSELAVNPTGLGGFNPELGIQSAQQFELGIRFNGRQSAASLTAYHIRSTNELTPYELEAFPGRTFYQNAGSTLRKGIEFEYQTALGRHLNLATNYTYMYAVFTKGEYNGFELPGLPRHQGFTQLEARLSKQITATLERTYRGRLFANNSATTRITEVFVDQFRLQYSHTNLTLTGGINNLLNRTYADNIRVNAFGGRFYETALPRQLYFGMNATF